MSKYQADMADYYDVVIEQKKKDFEQEVNNIEILNTKLQSQQDVVDKAVEDLEKALEEYRTKQIFKFIFSVAMDVFTLGASLAFVPVGAPAEATKLYATAKKIKEILDVLDALSTIISDIKVIIDTIERVENALEATGTDGTDLPTALEWQEYYENMQLTLDNATRDITDKEVNNAKATLLSAFKILVLRGQELLNVQSRTVQILTEIYFTNKRKEVNQNQADRLEALLTAINPEDIKDLDESSVDLVGLTAQLEFQEKQVLLLLAKTLVVQDQALQYEYLGTPTSIGSFDLLSLRLVIVYQKQAILDALSNLNPPPQQVVEPIIYEIEGIPSQALINGNGYQFTVCPSAKEFWQYAMVRIDKVIVETDDVQSTDSGQYLIELVCQGVPFEDRNQNRQTLLFNTVQRGFGPYLYEVDTNKPLFGTNEGSIANHITNITPFSQWRVSFSDTQTNKGIKLRKDYISLRLKFYVTALLRDPRSFLFTGTTALVKRNLASDTLLAGDVPANYQTDSLNEVLDQMYEHGSVMNGWDVVFNYTEESINELLEKQYENRKNLPEFFWEISKQINSEAIGNVCIFTEWQITFKAPKIEFLNNNSNSVKVLLDVVSGYSRRGVFIGEEDIECSEIDYSKIQWQEAQNISPDGYLEGNVPLAKLEGEVLTENKVIVKLSQGAFLTHDFDVDLNNATLNMALTEYMQRNNFIYTLGTIDKQDITTLPSLTPTTFLFNTVNTKVGKNILQLYITTTGEKQFFLGLDVDEPIPEGYGCSLMVNTKILWQDIFVGSFKSNNSTIKVASEAPLNNGKSYWAYATSGDLYGRIDFGKYNGMIRINGGNTIVWKLKGLKFLPSKNSGIELDYNETQTVLFEVWTPLKKKWSREYTDVTIKVTGTQGIEIVGSGLDQKVKIDSNEPDVTIVGTIHHKQGCNCENNEYLKQSFDKQLKQQVPEQLAKQIGGIEFEPISLFALKNLLFPGQNIVVLESAYIPGDLAIFGNFDEI